MNQMIDIAAYEAVIGRKPRGYGLVAVRDWRYDLSLHGDLCPRHEICTGARAQSQST